MVESVILQSPAAMLLYGIALLLRLLEGHFRSTNGLLFLISTAIAAVATGYCILIGVALTECMTVLLVFLLLNMGVRE